MAAKTYFRYFLFLLFFLVLFFAIRFIRNKVEVSEYLRPEPVATHANGSNFVGSTTCMECHADIYSTHLGTAHFKTSSTADGQALKGAFNTGSNVLNLPGVRLEMISEKGLHYQLSKAKFGDTGTVKSKLDIVIGSGVKGQSYLHWQEDDALVQLQVSYFVPTGSWVNSPNFPDYAFTRKVDDTCLKCHVTTAPKKAGSGPGIAYDRTRMILGVDCERCHGPAQKHVQYHRSNPEGTQAKFMGDFDQFSRQQRLDACAVCHSGLQNRQVKGNPFSFLAGDTLALYSENYKGMDTKVQLDVHGNQVGLLRQSACFKNTQKMDCMTCHDPHKDQRGDATSFNLKCMSCHDLTKMDRSAQTKVHTAQQNCISCHMPLIPSKAMKLEAGAAEIPVYVRTHLIGIYGEKVAAHPAGQE